MSKLPYVIFSPHCDDALLALGGHIIQNDGAEVVTLFGTCAWTVQSQVSNSEEITRLNREEEQAALLEASCTSYCYDLPEVLLRGYRKWDTRKIHKADDSIRADVEKLVKNHIRPSSTLFIPLAVEGHVDHRLVKAALLNLMPYIRSRDCKVYLYEDLPYSWYEDPQAYVSVLKRSWEVSEEVLKIDAYLEKKLALLSMYETQLSCKELTMVKEYSQRPRKGQYSERVWLIR